MEDMRARYGWRAHTKMVVWSLLSTAAFVGVCVAWGTTDWRWLAFCIPFILAVKYAQ